MHAPTTAANATTETKMIRHTVGRMDALETGCIPAKHAEIKQKATRTKPQWKTGWEVVTGTAVTCDSCRRLVRLTVKLNVKLNLI